MPFVRYFVGVGGALLALLFIVNIYLPKPAELPPQQQRVGVDKSTIRITSTQKGPERVEIDTSLPTIVPATDVALAQSRPLNTAAAQSATQVSSREAFAQMDVPAKPAIAAAPPRKTKPKIARTESQRQYAQQPMPTRVVMAQRQPSFFGGLFGTW
ncbi:hypothetical protein [Bradyrhizobium prioriisuperbiae]|uniref:hypothetical protein n=1 Tax=Bradyrhizobium prioriisuperbiae TaxID=2854389 RepID=UPI0028E25331|nr:hypothetical protein [Bradyrhizobium prioritasuperba]